MISIDFFRSTPEPVTEEARDGILADLFGTPRPAPVTIIRNVLGEEIDRVPARDLYNQDLRGKQWMHADLSGMSLFGANMEGVNLFGARLYRTDFQKATLRGAELAFSYAAGANFRGSDMRGCSLYRAEIGLRRTDTRLQILQMPSLMRLAISRKSKCLANAGCE